MTADSQTRYKAKDSCIDALLFMPENNNINTWPSWLKDCLLLDKDLIRYCGVTANPVGADCIFLTKQDDKTGLYSIYSSIQGYQVLRYGNYIVKTKTGRLKIISKNIFEEEYIKVNNNQHTGE